MSTHARARRVSRRPQSTPSALPAAGPGGALDALAPFAAELAGLGYWRWDEAGARFSWSPGMYRIYGMDPAEPPLTLEELDARTHPDDVPILLEHRRAKAGKDAEVTVRIVRRDGEVRWVRSRSTARLDPEGRVIERIGVLLDVTDAKAAEEAARRSEERYRIITDHAPDMITVSRMGGAGVFISPSSIRVLGYTPEELVKLNPVDRIHPEDRDRVMQAFGRLTNERLPALPEPLRYRSRHADGAWVWIEANPIPIRDARGELVEFVDVVRNVTQTVAFEKELEDARARAEDAASAKAAFLATMSHELRTPLTSIIGFSQLLSGRTDLPDEARHGVRRIADASEALLAIINDVLDFSKLEAGRVALEDQPFDPRRLIEDSAGLLAIQAAAKGVEVVVDLDAGIPAAVRGDVARLRQVLLNLLSNAVKFTREGRVTVRARWKPAGRLRVSVVDTGPGIAPEHVGALFQRFSQAELSVNRTHGGTGLGLAISKGIVELMGGQVGVRTALGRGSTFWFEIPAAPAAEVAPDHRPEASAELPPLRLLMVDDTAVNRELVRLMLAPLGVEIDEAAGGAEGVEAALAAPYDLVLMDVRMPGVDGLEATRRIRAGAGPNRAAPILALTADVQPENVAACTAAGMDAVLAKPIVPAQLLSQILHFATRAGEARADAAA